MKRLLFFVIVSVFATVSCGGQRSIDYTTHTSANGSYKVDIPSKFGMPRKVADMIQVVGGNDGPSAEIIKVSYSSLSAYLNSGDAHFVQGTKRKFNYNVKESSENLVAYKVTTPTTMMFSACSIYGFKKLKSGNYVINVMQVNGDLNYYKGIVLHMIDSLQDIDSLK